MMDDGIRFLSLTIELALSLSTVGPYTVRNPITFQTEGDNNSVGLILILATTLEPSRTLSDYALSVAAVAAVITPIVNPTEDPTSSPMVNQSVVSLKSSFTPVVPLTLISYLHLPVFSSMYCTWSSSI